MMPSTMPTKMAPTTPMVFDPSQAVVYSGSASPNTYTAYNPVFTHSSGTTTTSSSSSGSNTSASSSDTTGNRSSTTTSTTVVEKPKYDEDSVRAWLASRSHHNRNGDNEKPQIKNSDIVNQIQSQQQPVAVVDLNFFDSMSKGMNTFK